MSKPGLSVPTPLFAALMLGITACMFGLSQPDASPDLKAIPIQYSKAVLYLTHTPNGKKCPSLHERKLWEKIELGIAVGEMITGKKARETAWQCCPTGFSEAGLRASGVVQKNAKGKPVGHHYEVVCVQD